MDERALLQGVSTLRVVLAAGGILVASIGGAFALGVVGAPSVVGVENRFGDVTNQTTVIETDLVVNNPNPIGVQLGGTTVNYTVNMNDVRMASGQKEGLDVATGNSTLNFTTRMNNQRIDDWWVTHIRRGETTNVTIDANIRTSLLGNRNFDVTQNKQIETDIIGAFASDETRPVNANRPVVSDPVLYINRTTAEWGDVTREETPIPMDFVVYNPKSTPYTITEVGYTITMNGIQVGEGATDETYVIPGGATKTVETAPTIQNPTLPTWWASHLRNDQVTELRIDFYARIDLGTTTVRVPLDALTYERTIETDIFGNKESSSAGGSASGSATPTPADETGSPTDEVTGTDSPVGGVTGTESPLPDDTVVDGTPTPEPAASPTPTPTDDGLIDLSP